MKWHAARGCVGARTFILASGECCNLLTMRLAAALLLACTLQAQTAKEWRSRLDEVLPRFGHRNWIVIADSAYPLQSAPGIETISSGESQIETVRHVLAAISRQPHVRPVVYLDQELHFVPEADAPGVGAYRQLLDGTLSKFGNIGLRALTLPHESIIGKLDDASRTFNVLIIKTGMTIPYTSVFIQLNAAYWGDEAEERLRQSMQH